MLNSKKTLRNDPMLILLTPSQDNKSDTIIQKRAQLNKNGLIATARKAIVINRLEWKLKNENNSCRYDSFFTLFALKIKYLH